MSKKSAATREAIRHGLNAVVVILVFIAVTYIWNPIGALGDFFRGDNEEIDWSEIAQAVEQEIDAQVQFLEGDGSSLTRSELRASRKNATDESLKSAKF